MSSEKGFWYGTAEHAAEKAVEHVALHYMAEKATEGGECNMMKARAAGAVLGAVKGAVTLGAPGAIIGGIAGAFIPDIAG